MAYSEYRNMALTWEYGRDGEFPYRKTVDGVSLEIRVGDFPDEFIYNLLVDAVEVDNFDAWPENWTRPVG
ncbi:hypothetical protein [Nocardia camponoti]|uniref:Uncharacterized protein n=1 Tax=Nocardia camponoti TaxID=1616106 RepID=A0A917QIG6_9NOCA|nr:hypothetical protein [Nocardia camponoti]GGK52818.1 hypothetical protein GCM10011591_25700 [Nocardia camponoti]